MSLSQINQPTLRQPVVIMTALTTRGPEIVSSYPTLELTMEEKQALAMKSLPMGGNCGDMVTVTINDFQMISVLLLVHSYENTYDNRDTQAALGIITYKDMNPIPYQKLLTKIASVCKENSIVQMQALKEIMVKLYDSLNKNQKSKFTIDFAGQKVNFLLEKELVDLYAIKYEPTELTNSMNLVPILTLDEIMNREANAFLIDKFILKLVASEYPISIEEIRKKVLPLESVIGARIELPTIKEICRKYIALGIIKVQI